MKILTLKTASKVQNMKKLIPYLTVIALSCPLAGCFLEEEKSYEYYVMHPVELYHDYEYCDHHPSSGVCFNIIKKYFRYQKNLALGSVHINNGVYSNANNGMIKQIGQGQHTRISKGAIFRNIDEPANSYDLN